MRAPKRPYKVICISVYNDDLQAMDAKVALMRAKGWTKMSRSGLIREALDRLDVRQLPERQKQTAEQRG